MSHETTVKSNFNSSCLVVLYLLIFKTIQDFSKSILTKKWKIFYCMSSFKNTPVISTVQDIVIGTLFGIVICSYAVSGNITVHWLKVIYYNVVLLLRSEVPERCWKMCLISNGSANICIELIICAILQKIQSSLRHSLILTALDVFDVDSISVFNLGLLLGDPRFKA